MTPAEAMAAQPPARDRATWIFLPQAAHGWLVGEECSIKLAPVLSFGDELEAHERLAEWDALAGKLLRETLFADGNTRHVRKTAEAVASVAEQLAVALGARR